MSIVRGVHELASRRGWKPVEALAATILAGDYRKEILLVCGTRVDAAPLRSWIQRTVEGAKVDECEMRKMVASRSRALCASKLVAVLECGRLLEAAEVQAVFDHLVPR